MTSVPLEKQAPNNVAAENRLNTLWQKGRDFLGTDLAILGGAMTWVSDADLVSALSNGGGFGVLASGAMPQEILRQEIQKTRSLTNKPFGVNLITLHPDLAGLIQICIEENVSHVALAGGIPTKASVEILKAAGIKVICFAPALPLAKRMIQYGTDALVIEGHEAGGHIGPVSTSVLAQEILPTLTKDFPHIPTFIAGGIGRGDAMITYLEMGASGCQLGTRFVCATECNAHPDFKKAFMKGQARHAVVSPQLDARLPVIPVRALHNKGMDAFIQAQKDVIQKLDQGLLDQKEAQMEIEHFWAGALRRAVVEGDIESGSLMAGQSVGMVKSEQPCQEILDDLTSEALEFIQKQLDVS